jgi:hypothetical protein
MREKPPLTPPVVLSLTSIMTSSSRSCPHETCMHMQSTLSCDIGIVFHEALHEAPSSLVVVRAMHLWQRWVPVGHRRLSHSRDRFGGKQENERLYMHPWTHLESCRCWLSGAHSGDCQNRQDGYRENVPNLPGFRIYTLHYPILQASKHIVEALASTQD